MGEDIVSDKSSSQSDSIFNSEGEEEDDDSKVSDELDFDSEWTEANAIFGQDSDDAQEISGLILQH